MREGSVAGPQIAVQRPNKDILGPGFLFVPSNSLEGVMNNVQQMWVRLTTELV